VQGDKMNTLTLCSIISLIVACTTFSGSISLYTVAIFNNRRRFEKASFVLLFLTLFLLVVSAIFGFAGDL
jgi:hypothetical protein